MVALRQMVMRFGVGLGVLFGVACGGGGDTRDAVEDTRPTPDTKDVDTAEAGPALIACCPLGNCEFGKECVAGACLPETRAADLCYFDGECPAGATCEGENVCGCGIPVADCAAVPGHCSYPAGCCNRDGDCQDGGVCEAGQCRPKPTEGRCWRDDQCEGTLVCNGATICPCGADDCVDVAGTCSVPGACCGTDAECGDGQCLGGRCLPKSANLPQGACWADGDCGAGEACLGASLCACVTGYSEGSECVVPSTPGRCGMAADACCSDDADCGAAKICVNGEGCVAAPKRDVVRDECWIDAHCGVGRICENANICGCKEDGCTTSKVGHCTTPVIACSENDKCPVGMRCTRPDAGYCPDEPNAKPEAVCVPLEDENRCWASEDCEGYTRCDGETVCIDQDGCSAPNRPGYCGKLVPIRECCTSHLDCAEGLECRNNDASLTCPVGSGAVCLPKPQFGESCWNLFDCPEGKTCQRVMVCGCNGKCRWNNMGQCETPKYCDTDLDCGSDSVCAHDTECIISPCTTSSTCPIGGRCQLKEEGRCWNNEECEAGQYCEGLRVCPVDTTCVAPDQPGVCAARAALGKCCTSLRGCEPGLRCVSPTTRSGCRADFSSVCVPAITLGTDCYGDDDCETGQRCQGAVVCPCGVENCTSEPQAGTCVVDN